MGDSASFGFYLYRIRRDHDLLRHGTNFKIEGDAQRLTDFQGDPGEHKSLKSWLLGGNRITSNRDPHQRVFAARIRLHGPGEALIGIGNRNPGVRHSRTRPIVHRADDAGEGLRVCFQGHQHQQSRCYRHHRFHCDPTPSAYLVLSRLRLGYDEGEGGYIGIVYFCSKICSGGACSTFRVLPFFRAMAGTIARLSSVAPAVVALLLSSLLAQQLATSQNAKAVFEHGQRALSLGQYGDAERDFNRVLQLGTRSAPTYANLGVVYLRTNRIDAAIKILRQAEQLAPDTPGIRLNLGLAYFKKHEFKKAIPNFGYVISSDPRNVQAHYLMGVCDFMTDDFGAAVTAFEPILDSQQDDLELLYMLGISYGMMKRPDDARSVFERLVKAGGDTPHLHLLL